MKKILSIVLTVILVVAIVPLGALTASAVSRNGLVFATGYNYDTDSYDATLVRIDGNQGSTINLSGSIYNSSNGNYYYANKVAVDAFEDYPYAENVTNIVMGGIESIPSGALKNYQNIKVLTYNGSLSLSHIFGGSYYVPSSLKKVTIGGCNMTSSTLSGGYYLENVSIICSNYEKTKIYPTAFTSVPNLKSVYVENAGGGFNDWYLNSGGIIDKSNYELIVGESDSYIDSYVKIIGSSAYSGRTGLTSITIPDNVTQINSSAFKNCTSLTEITIPESVTYLAGGVFSGCTNLKTVNINSSLYNIESETFKNCKSLNAITIPTSVKRIYQDAFSGCDGMEIAYYEGTPAQWAEITVKSGNEALTDVIICASGDCGEDISWSLDVYGKLKISGNGNTDSYNFANLTPWYDYSEYITSVEIENTITNIGDYSFNSLTNLKNVITHNADLTFGYYAFPENTTAEIKGYGNSSCESYAKQNNIKFVKYDNPQTAVEPTVRYRSTNTIILNAVSGYEYSIDGKNWRSSTAFTGLNAGTEYTVYQRIVSGVYAPSTPSQITVSTVGAPDAPTFDSVVENTVTLTPYEGYEYSKDGTNWQTSNIFYDIPYSAVSEFYQRLAVSPANSVSPSSYASKCYISPNADIFIGKSALKIIPTEGYEYRLDNQNWQDSNVFTGLVPNKSYTVYQRLKGDETSEVQIFYNTDGITVTMNGSDLTDSPDAETVLWIRNILLTEKNCRNFGADFNGDYTVNVKDLVNIKKTIAAQSVNLEDICDIDYTLLADTGDEIYDYKLRFNIDGSCNYTAIGYISGNSTEKTFKFTYSNYEINIYDNANTLLLTLKNNQNTSLNITYVNSSLELSGGLNRAQIFNK